MINDELRKQINNAQRMKCFQSSVISVIAGIVWIMLFSVQVGTSINNIIIVTICAVVITILALAVIFCDMGKATFELEAKNDPTKG